jgi:hypothetical protein
MTQSLGIHVYLLTCKVPRKFQAHTGLVARCTHRRLLAAYSDAGQATTETAARLAHMHSKLRGGGRFD